MCQKVESKPFWFFSNQSVLSHVCKIEIPASPNDSKLDRTSLNWPLQHHKTKVKQHHRLYILRVLVQSIRSGPLKVRAANQCGGVCVGCVLFRLKSLWKLSFQNKGQSITTKSRGTDLLSDVVLFYDIIMVSSLLLKNILLAPAFYFENYLCIIFLRFNFEYSN